MINPKPFAYFTRSMRSLARKINRQWTKEEHFLNSLVDRAPYYPESRPECRDLKEKHWWCDWTPARNK